MRLAMKNGTARVTTQTIQTKTRSALANTSQSFVLCRIAYIYIYVLRSKTKAYRAHEQIHRQKVVEVLRVPYQKLFSPCIRSEKRPAVSVILVSCAGATTLGTRCISESLFPHNKTSRVRSTNGFHVTVNCAPDLRRCIRRSPCTVLLVSCVESVVTNKTSVFRSLRELPFGAAGKIPGFQHHVRASHAARRHRIVQISVASPRCNPVVVAVVFVASSPKSIDYQVDNRHYKDGQKRANASVGIPFRLFEVVYASDKKRLIRQHHRNHEHK